MAQKNGTCVTDVYEYVMHGGGTRTGFYDLYVTKPELRLDNLDLKTSFTAGNDFKVFNPQTTLNGQQINVLTAQNGYEFTVFVNDNEAGHPKDDEFAYWYVEGMTVKPEVWIYYTNSPYSMTPSSPIKAGTYTVTLSSVKANYSYHYNHNCRVQR